MIMVSSCDKAPAGISMEKLPSSLASVPPAAPITAWVAWPLGVPGAVACGSGLLLLPPSSGGPAGSSSPQLNKRTNATRARGLVRFMRGLLQFGELDAAVHGASFGFVVARDRLGVAEPVG